MDVLLKIKKLLYSNKYKEYISVEQQLRARQIESAKIFIKVKDDPNRNTGSDPELKEINDKCNKLAMRLIELRKIFESNKKKH